jgi:hypothetical protein
MMNRLRITAREDKELRVLSGRGLGVIKIRRTKKRGCFFFIVIYAGRRRLCAEDLKSTEEAQHIECRWSTEHKTQKKS